MAATVHSDNRRISHFDCSLNPRKIVLVINAFCTICQLMEMPMDIVHLIAMFFDHIVYVETKANSPPLQYKAESFESDGDFSFGALLNYWPTESTLMGYCNRPRPLFQFVDFGISGYRSANINLLEEFEAPTLFPNRYRNRTRPLCICPTDQPQHVQRIQELEFLVNAVGCNLWLIKWNQDAIPQSAAISSMVIRIRMFATQCNWQEVVIRNITKDDDEWITVSADEENTEVEAIGVEVEIVHILYKNDNYWCREPYSWFQDIIYPHIQITDEIDTAFCNYFDSGCFMVAEKRYYLLTEYHRKNTLTEFFKYYFEAAMHLPYDVVLVMNDSSQVLLSEHLKEKIEAVVLAIKDMEEFENAIIALDAKESKRKQAEQRVQLYQQRKTFKDRLNKPPKLGKLYRNNKKKYKYHRW